MAEQAAVDGTARPAEEFGPIPLAERGLTQDALRGIAVLTLALAVPAVADVAAPGAPLAVFALVNDWHLLVGDPLTVLLGLLVGYGIAQYCTRAERLGLGYKVPASLLRRRASYLAVIGIALSLFIGAELLAIFGIVTLIFVGAVRWTSRTLINVAGFLVSLLVVYYGWLASIQELVGLDYLLPQAGFSPGRLMFKALSLIPALVLGTLGMIAPVLFGIWLARFRPLEQPDTHAAWLRRVAAIGIAGGLVSAIPYFLARFGVLDVSPLSLAYVEDERNLLAPVEVHPAAYVLGGLRYLSTFLLPVGWAALLAYANRAGTVTRALAAVGKTPLTGLFLVEVAVFAVFGVGGVRIPYWGAALVGVTACLFVLALAILTDRSGRRGRVEALVRKITYRR